MKGEQHYEHCSFYHSSYYIQFDLNQLVGYTQPLLLVKIASLLIGFSMDPRLKLENSLGW